MIYKPKGKAGEYANLAANIWQGCGGRCAYCFVPMATFQDRSEFHSRTYPKRNALEILEKDAARIAGKSDGSRILLSFSSDPYPNEEMRERLTRKSITILHKYGLNVAILTKNGYQAMQDFGLLNSGDLFGVTLTFINPADSLMWEPGAELPINRLAALELAHKNNIPTFASMEPVISPRQTLELIEKSAPFIDHYKVGKLNHESSIPSSLPRPQIDWCNFANEVIALLESMNKLYYIKKDLARYVGRNEGFSNGTIPL